MAFNQLNLHPLLLTALQKCGYEKPTPIQQQAIPRALAGKDLIAIAQTGTGKTAAFVLPALQQLLETQRQYLPSILILAPVRELAAQITDAIKKYSHQMRIKVANILGGMPYHAQMRQLQQGVDIIVATPGRLIDYLNRGQIVDLSQIKTLVLDEADRMLDMGFIEDIKVIANFLPKQRQTLLFTATMDATVIRLAEKILHQPEKITIPSKSITLENIKQFIYITDDTLHKNALLKHFITQENIYKAIIFTGTKHFAEKLSRQLYSEGHDAAVLHGDIKQQKRNRILQEFHKGKIQFLVATDLAARGIDVRDISHVINYDLPRTGEDYVHRIGRTGRAGKSGCAISFIATNEIKQLKRIEDFIKDTLTLQQIAGLEPKSPQRPAAPKNTKKSWYHKNRNEKGRQGHAIPGKTRKNSNNYGKLKYKQEKSFKNKNNNQTVNASQSTTKQSQNFEERRHNKNNPHREFTKNKQKSRNNKHFYRSR